MIVQIFIVYILDAGAIGLIIYTAMIAIITAIDECGCGYKLFISNLLLTEILYLLKVGSLHIVGLDQSSQPFYILVPPIHRLKMLTTWPKTVAFCTPKKESLFYMDNNLFYYKIMIV